MTPEPVACTLTAGQLREDAADLLPGLIAAARAVAWQPEGVTLTLDAADGLLTRIAAVIERERGCCAFLRFTLDVAPGRGPVTFEVTGPAGTRAVLEALGDVLHQTDRPPS